VTNVILKKILLCVSIISLARKLLFLTSWKVTLLLSDLRKEGESMYTVEAHEAMTAG